MRLSIKARISFALMLAPAVAGMAFASMMGATGVESAATFVLFVLLGALTWCDGTTQTVPDGLTFPLIASGFAYSAIAGSALTGAGICAVVLICLALLKDRIAPDRGPIGSGDYLLFAGAIAWLGLRTLPDLIIITAVLLGVFAIFAQTTRVAVAPALSLAIAFLWFGDLIP